MSFSDVQICNIALLKYGDVTISSLSDTSKHGIACALLYPYARDQLMAAYPWNFAMHRADITPDLTTTPDFEWDYAYTLPTDCLRAWEIWSASGQEIKWQVESNTLLTNIETDVYLKYIKQVTTTGRFSMGFVSCLTLLLGAELSAKMKGNLKVRNDLLVELNKVELPKALKQNADEGNRNLSIGEQSLDNGNFSWQTTGHSGELIQDTVFSS